MTLECNSSSFKSYIFYSVMMSIGREIAWELHAYITEHGLDGLWKHSSALHATEKHGTHNSVNQQIEWPSSTLHALSMRTAFLHFIKLRRCRSAVHTKFTNCQFSQILVLGVIFWKFHNICNRTQTFRLCENLETLTENDGFGSSFYRWWFTWH